MVGTRRPRGNARPLGYAALLLLAVPLVLASLAGCEAAKPAVKAEPKGEPDLLEKAAKFISAQKTFQVAVDIEMRVEAQGQKQVVKTAYSLSAERPNRVAMRMKTGEFGVTLVSDGKVFLRGIANQKRYMVSESPDSVSEVFNDPSAQLLGLGVGGPFFSALVSDDPYKQFTSGVKATRNLGAEEVDGHACQKLHFEQDNYDWDAWIDSSAEPLIRKVSFQLKKFPGLEVAQLPDMKLAVAYTLHGWQLDPKFADDEFAIDVPESWKKVDNLFGQPSSEEKKAPSPLLGKAAPNFKLEKLGGGEVDLASHRDKDVVILDFWATWCVPCRAALPTIAKVAKEYQDRGVVFYAVDLREAPDKVATFLTDEKLDIPAIFDRDGAVAKDYLVKGIPQTVLIGKDGTVQVVHIGLLPDLETRLTSELHDLVAGKDLAAETLKEAEE